MSSAWWKRAFDVQAPYRWNFDRLKLGFTLDIGCGIGRTLKNLRGNGVGVDHNPHAVMLCKELGFQAYSPADFKFSSFAQNAQFDTLLLAHVAEHMTVEECTELLGSYLQYLKPDGKVLIVTPQEVGQRSDPTHVHFMDFKSLREIFRRLELTEISAYSFPFPRWAGKLFIYNEFVALARKTAD
jgi:SAM-dependent methyltransferase